MLDPLLRSFVETPDEVDAERELSALIERHALPLAQVIVGRKLRCYKDDRPGRAVPDDRDDVVADAMVTLIERLRAARAGTDPAPVENFINYAAVVIHSTCAHHLRRRYPERARLKNRLRYVFSTDHRLAIWTTKDDDLACGLAEWRGRSIDADAERAARDVGERGRQRWAVISRAELADAASDVVASLGGPVDFEVFVRAASSATGLVEPRRTHDPALLPAREPAHDVTIDQRRFLARVWDEVRLLPVRQRIALLLNLRDATGAGVLWLLPIAGVTTMRHIARVLEIDDAEFAGLWRQLPLDDASIGQRLGCTRQQVINLRMAARKRLLNRAGASDPGPRGSGANLAPFSASLRR